MFASEAKALFAHPRIEPKLDLTSFYHYLSFRAVPAPRSLFEGIEKLGAGELMVVDVATGRGQRRVWWDPLTEAAPAPATREAAVDRLDELMGSSMDMRLESDVPVGVFLSGGVDSGLLLKMAADRKGSLDTFTVHYPGHDKYNEHHDAATLAKACGARHHEVPIHGGEYAASMATVAYHQDEPIAAPVCTPVYMLAQAARNAGVPVVLAGEGSDEIFIGYENWIRFRRLMQIDRLLPDLPGRLLRKVGHAALSASLSPLATHPEVLRRSKAGQPLFWSGAMDFGEDAKRRLLGPAVPTAGLDTYEAVIGPVWERYREARPAKRHGWLDDLRGPAVPPAGADAAADGQDGDGPLGRGPRTDPRSQAGRVPNGLAAPVARLARLGDQADVQGGRSATLAARVRLPQEARLPGAGQGVA